MLNRILTLFALLATAVVTPQTASAQAESGVSNDRCANFNWLLGTWSSYSPWGDQSAPSGGTLVFTMGANGTIEGRIGQMNSYMEENGYASGMLVYRGFKEVRYYGPDRVTLYQSFGGEFFQVDRDGRAWRQDTIGVRPDGRLYMSPPSISRLSGHGPFRKSSTTQSSGECATDRNPTSDPTLSGANDQSKSNASSSQEPPTPDRKRKKCKYPNYQILALGSSDSVIKRFEQDTNDFASYDSSLPGRRLYPNPVDSAAKIPVRYMDLEDYRTLSEMEALTAEIIDEGGLDKAFAQAMRDITKLYKEARGAYDLSARIADRRELPCPVFTDPDALPKITAGDAAMAALLARRKGELEKRLSSANALNEKLTRAFFSDLAETGSLDEKQKMFVEDIKQKAKDKLKAYLANEKLEPKQIEDLVPQLEALEARFEQMRAEGREVTDSLRDKELKDALKRSGIAYDPALTRSAKRDGQNAVGKAFLDTLQSELGPKPTGVFGQLAAAMSYFQAAKVSLETLNALKNLYTLFKTKEDLMPVALAVQEDRIYIRGLAERYDKLEAEYALMRRDFERAITEGGALSESE